MDKNAQDRMRAVLETTLEDARLSRSERRALDQVLDEAAGDPGALGFVRNEALALVRARVDGEAARLLGWLDKVLRSVGGARTRVAMAEGPAAEDDRVAFAPGDDCHQLVLGEVRAARRSVDVCVFTITDDRLTAALLDAKARGLDVRVVTDDEKASDLGSDVERLRAAGIPVRTDDAPDHMHHKFVLLDGRRLVHGSFNWTRSAAANHEAVHATSVAPTVGAFAATFERLWAAF